MPLATQGSHLALELVTLLKRHESDESSCRINSQIKLNSTFHLNVGVTVFIPTIFPKLVEKQKPHYPPPPSARSTWTWQYPLPLLCYQEHSQSLSWIHGICFLSRQHYPKVSHSVFAEIWPLPRLRISYWNSPLLVIVRLVKGRLPFE